jgi:hypothetical protein
MRYDIKPWMEWIIPPSALIISKREGSRNNIGPTRDRDFKNERSHPVRKLYRSTLFLEFTTSSLCLIFRSSHYAVRTVNNILSSVRTIFIQ